MKKIYTIGVPLKYGCSIDGADLGIDVLKKEILFDKILNIDYVDTEVNSQMKHINTVLKCDEQLASEVYQSLNSGKKVITIGGDHSLAVGSIAGSAAYHPIGILWIDSHGDLNNEKTTLTGNVHGFPLASSIGLGPSCLNNCYQTKTKVQKENIVLFGCSDLDDEEEKIIDENDLHIFKYADVQHNFKNQVMNAVNYLKSHIDTIHLSIDLDSIHPDKMCAVNLPTRAGIGLSFEQIYYLIDAVFANLYVQSVDIVEYNPLHDHEFQGSKEVVKLYQYIVDKLAKQK